MANDRVQMPSGMGGLVRYFDEYKSNITFKPGHVIIIIAVIVAIVIILHWQGSAWLGLK
ncbi:MAG: preprotein translocase subunit Sec61beta [Candidatus Woesearchaeota archaeon]|jgi:preprotein translocase subunit Sec61beta|nr:preprotein translocase subunit Sec61beta [Candidatus Woesearchaeota archaeon]